MTCPKCKGKLELLFVSWQCPSCDLGETKPAVKQGTVSDRIMFNVALLDPHGWIIPQSVQRYTSREILDLCMFTWDTSKFIGTTIHGITIESDNGGSFSHHCYPIVASGNNLIFGAEVFHRFVRDVGVGS